MKKVENLDVVLQLIEAAEKNLNTAKQLLMSSGINMTVSTSQVKEQTQKIQEKVQSLSIDSGGKTLEGIFDGQNMVGPEGRIYPVPANYASKSKLVVGDLLRLFIADDGGFVYKQIKPVERRRLIGSLSKNAKGEYYVTAEGVAYRVLLAALTYYKATDGDKVTIVIPHDSTSVWAAVENVIKHDMVEDSMQESISFEPTMMMKKPMMIDLDEEL